MRPLQRTSGWAVLAFAAVGFGAGFLVEIGLSSAGRAPLVPPYSLPATLVTISLILLGFAIALRRSVTGANKKQVNPFTAVRIVAAAKASILSGALFGGFSLGILVYFGMRTVAPQPDSWWPVIVSVIAALVQLVAGFVSEYLCRVPPTDDDEGGAGDGDTARRNSDGPEASGAVTAHRNEGGTV